MLYILKRRKPVKEPDPIKWTEWMAKKRCKIDVTFITNNITKEKTEISTVFVGFNCNFSEGRDPILFETMIFGGKFDKEIERCSTWDEAVQMHQKAVNKVLSVNLIAKNAEEGEN